MSPLALLRRRDGFALPTAVLVMCVSVILIYASTCLLRAQSRETLYVARSLQAQAAAEAGLEDALYQMYVSQQVVGKKNPPLWRTGYVNKAFYGGSYTVVVSTDAVPFITSTGFASPILKFGAAAKTVRAQLLLNNSGYGPGNLANSTFTVNGLLDSYDSSVAINPTAYGSLANAAAMAGFVAPAGAVRVKGDVYYYSGSGPAAGTVTGAIVPIVSTAVVATTSGAAFSCSTCNNNATGINPSSVYTAATKALNIPKGTKTTLSPGIYYFNSMAVEDWLTFATTASSSVTIYLNGNLCVECSGSNQGQLINASQIPAQVVIYGQSGGGAISLNSSKSVQMDLQAANHDVTINQVLYGRVFGRQVTVTSGGILHFDVQYLPTIAVGTRWVGGTWSETYRKK